MFLDKYLERHSVLSRRVDPFVLLWLTAFVSLCSRRGFPGIGVSLKGCFPFYGSGFSSQNVDCDMSGSSTNSVKSEAVHGEGPVKDSSGRYSCIDPGCTESFRRRSEWR